MEKLESVRVEHEKIKEILEKYGYDKISYYEGFGWDFHSHKVEVYKDNPYRPYAELVTNGGRFHVSTVGTHLDLSDVEKYVEQLNFVIRVLSEIKVVNEDLVK